MYFVYYPDVFDFYKSMTGPIDSADAALQLAAETDGIVLGPLE
jgi:hypothetical protein